MIFKELLEEYNRVNLRILENEIVEFTKLRLLAKEANRKLGTNFNVTSDTELMQSLKEFKEKVGISA